MGSNALNGLLAGLEEADHLLKANPTPRGGLPKRPKVARALNRAAVVLIASHLERYLHAVNEELAEGVNSSTVSRSSIPETLRLQHSRNIVDDLFKTQWNNRAKQLGCFVTSDGWLWGQSPKESLESRRLLKWMKTPKPNSIRRLFALWGIKDIFGTITRTAHTRQRMWLKLQELADKRNDIAHGNMNAEATYQDAQSYIGIVRRFCKSCDRAVGRLAGRWIKGSHLW